MSKEKDNTLNIIRDYETGLIEVLTKEQLKVLELINGRYSEMKVDTNRITMMSTPIREHCMWWEVAMERVNNASN
jgi:hypothetical protein